MGGFFGAVSRRDCVLDVFFGTDYHSHLGTKRGGMASWDRESGFQRAIHSIENTPFRTKMESELEALHGGICIGCISDTDPQPMLMRSHLGTYALVITGRVNNADELVEEFLGNGHSQFEVRSGGNINCTELVAALINSQPTLAEGIRYAQERVDGSLCLLLMKEGEELIAARDRLGRLPILIGRNKDGYCVSFESFAYQKLGYEDVRDLGPAEIVRITADGVEVLSPPRKEMRICAFLWSYYGYPNSQYEGVNVETMRYRNGQIMADYDREQNLSQDVDCVSGVPDSGIAHAVGYSYKGGLPFARPFIKYTPTWPRSFMPSNQAVRNQIAKMKMIPIRELIEGKKLLMVDDSIVRGTQLQETVDFLYSNGAEEVHMRSACPPIMYGCKYLNFSRSNSDMDLLARRVIQEIEGDEGQDHLDEYADGTSERGCALRQRIAEMFGFTSLEYQSLDGLIQAIGLPRDCICTYCWNGKE